MRSALLFKLSLMMFLEFFIWGAWLPPSFSFFGEGALGFSLWEQYFLNICFPLSAILAMFVGNQFVDRNFAAEKYLAFSHLIGGLAILGFGVLSWYAFSGENANVPSYGIFLALMAIHCFFYVPTISVTNTIAFANVVDAKRDFGLVRLWGTIGWIAASWPFIFILTDWAKVPGFGDVGFVEWLGAALGTPLEGTPLNQGKSWAFITSGIASLALAGVSLTLPHTPPKPAKPGKSLAWLEAMKELRRPFLLVLFIVTFIDATVHDGFFFFAFSYLGSIGVPSNWIQPAMSVGQIAEILTMAILGLVLKNLGWKATMIIGVMGHAIRFAVFAFMPDPYVAIAANLLHGICYAFFFATLYILVDEFFPKDARTSAQGLFNFLVLGAGPLTARFIWPWLNGIYTVDKVTDYSRVLLYPAGAALTAALMLLLFFYPPKKGTADENEPVPTDAGEP